MLIFDNRLLGDLKDVGCKSPFSLIKFIKTYGNREEEFKEFEGFFFEKDEVVEPWKWFFNWRKNHFDFNSSIFLIEKNVYFYFNAKN